jgi:hypothetical protein
MGFWFAIGAKLGALGRWRHVPPQCSLAPFLFSCRRSIDSPISIITFKLWTVLNVKWREIWEGGVCFPRCLRAISSLMAMGLLAFPTFLRSSFRFFSEENGDDSTWQIILHSWVASHHSTLLLVTRFRFRLSDPACSGLPNQSTYTSD